MWKCGRQIFPPICAINADGNVPRGRGFLTASVKAVSS